MDLLLENSAPIWVGGAILLTMAGIVYGSLRTTGALMAMVAVVLLTIAALFAEHFYLTPREQVQAALEDLMAAVEADDVTGVLGLLAPTASNIRSDAETLMPMFEIDKARTTGTTEVLLNGENSAIANARVFVQVRHKKSGMRGGDFAQVQFTYTRQGERWLVGDYDVSKEWRKKASGLKK